MDAQRKPLSDGRWHFQHGPIDIVIGASGRAEALQSAHEAAWERFSGILPELVAELPQLRQPVGATRPVRGRIARRMWDACEPYKNRFITPMAAVAGAVAQELIAFYASAGVERAWVNNGGDIALHLEAGQSLRVGLYADLANLDEAELASGIRTDGSFEVSSLLPVRGIATSGWRGRSFSLGIADSVTVLARTAAEADAAATMIANAVDVDDIRIARRPACDLKDGSDLGAMPVTVAVPELEPELVRRALHAGLRRAQALRSAGLIWSAVLVCQRRFVSTDAAEQKMLPKHSAEPQVGSVFA
jgi:ApbE superfamily uncharacterized protein (UPF0280 family)